MLFIFVTLISGIESSIDVNGIVTYTGYGIITSDVVKNSGTQTEIKGVEINGPSEIASEAFNEYGEITYISIPNSLIKIDSSAFFRNYKLSEFRIRDDHPTLYRDKQGGLFSKNLSILLQVPKTIKSFIIPESVQTVSARCFSSTSLDSIFFPASVTNLIGTVMNEVFGNCVITFANNSRLKVIPIGSFWYKSAVHIHIPSSVEEIQKVAFKSSGTKIFEFDDIENSNLTSLGSECFANFIGTSIKLLPKIKELPKGVFKNSVYLKTVNIPRDCEFIHPDAFAGCLSLYNVTVEYGNKNYTNIDGCVYSIDKKTICILPVGIENLTISEKLNDIGTGSIQNCKKLKNITVLPGSSTFFADKGVLYSANKKELIAVAGGITAVHVNSTVESFNRFSFSGVDVTKVTFEENSSLKYIFESAFASCQSLLYMDLPDNVLEIYSNAFDSCKIECVNIGPNSLLKNIHSYAFRGSSLKSFFFGPKLQAIYESAFSSSSLLTNITFSSSLSLIEISNYVFSNTNISGTFRIPPTLKTIGIGAFFNLNNLQLEFDGKSNVVSVGDGAFNGCSKVTNFEFGDDVELIDINSFRSTGITSIRINSSKMTAIRSGAFSYCKSLKSVDLPYSLKEASPTVFEGCVSLQAIRAHPKSEFFSTDDAGLLYSLNKNKLFICPAGKVNVILNEETTLFESRAFFKCSMLNTVDFLKASKLVSISEYTFLECTSLKEVKLPRSVVNLSGSCFNGCSNLKKVSFMDNSGLTEIKSSTFENCILLSEVDFGENPSLLKIGSKAFKRCTSLEKITIPKSCREIGDEAFASTGLKLISIQNTSIRSIPQQLFQGCESLENVLLPTNLNDIGSYFIAGTQVDNITLHEVNGISVGAFEGAEKLSHICLCGVVRLQVEGAIPSRVTIFVTKKYEGLEYCGLPVLKSLKEDCTLEAPATLLFTSEGGFLVPFFGFAEFGILTEGG